MKQAWKSDDGKYYDTEIEAAKADAAYWKTKSQERQYFDGNSIQVAEAIPLANHPQERRVSEMSERKTCAFCGLPLGVCSHPTELAQPSTAESQLQTLKELCGRFNVWATHKEHCPLGFHFKATSATVFECKCGLSELQQQARKV